MRKLGSPFQSNTLSNLILSVILALVMIYYYFQAEVQRPVHLLIVVVGIANAIRSYFSYTKFFNQGERRLVGDRE